MNKIYYNGNEYLYNMGISISGMEPSGTYNIIYNGTYDIASYASVDVQVSGGDATTEEVEDSFVMKTLSGTYYNSRVTSLPSYAFTGFSKLTSVNFPNVTSIGSYAFDGCSSLTSMTFGTVTSIGTYAFRSCRSLTTVNFPNVSIVPSYGFSYCSALTTVSFPSATSIGTYAFYSCSKLTSAIFPNVTSIGNYAFQYCYSLASISFPQAKLVSASAFVYCSALTAASFPNVTSIYGYAFYYCRNLSEIKLSNVNLFSGASIFGNCYNLVSLNLTGISAVPTLSSSNIFVSTPIGGYSTSAGRFGSIYVPSSLYNSFLTAMNWSLFSSCILSV